MTILCERVEGFLRTYPISPTRFGVLALKDPAFVFQLRNGRKVRASTAAAVEAWMDEYEKKRKENPVSADDGGGVRVLLVHPHASAPASLHVYEAGAEKPLVVTLTPQGALSLAGDLVQSAVARLSQGVDRPEALA